MYLCMYVCMYVFASANLARSGQCILTCSLKIYISTRKQSLTLSLAGILETNMQSIYTHTCTHTHARMHTYAANVNEPSFYLCMHAQNKYVDIYTYIHIYIHACTKNVNEPSLNYNLLERCIQSIHTHIHTYTHTRTHTQKKRKQTLI